MFNQGRLGRLDDSDREKENDWISRNPVELWGFYVIATTDRHPPRTGSRLRTLSSNPPAGVDFDGEGKINYLDHSRMEISFDVWSPNSRKWTIEFSVKPVDQRSSYADVRLRFESNYDDSLKGTIDIFMLRFARRINNVPQNVVAKNYAEILEYVKENEAIRSRKVINSSGENKMNSIEHGSDSKATRVKNNTRAQAMNLSSTKALFSQFRKFFAPDSTYPRRCTDERIRAIVWDGLLDDFERDQDSAMLWEILKWAVNPENEKAGLPGLSYGDRVWLWREIIDPYFNPERRSSRR
jgi:hypothetical protein